MSARAGGLGAPAGGAAAAAPGCPYSYASPRFAAFYDAMVDAVFGGAAAADARLVCLLAEAAAARELEGARAARGGSPELRVLDAGCGSGRILLALLRRRDAQDAAAGALARVRLRLWGADNSAPMLQSARRHLAAAGAAVAPEPPPAEADGSQQRAAAVAAAQGADHPAAAAAAPPASASLALLSFDELDLPGLLAAGGAHLAVVAAGGLHHVLERRGLLAALGALRRHLAPGGRLAVALMPWEHLCRDEGAAAADEAFQVRPCAGWRDRRSPFEQTAHSGPPRALAVVQLSRGRRAHPAAQVGAFTRTLLERRVAPGADGVPVVAERFRLAAQPEEGGAVEWEEEEGWQLRRLDAGELEALSEAAGLRPDRDVPASIAGAATAALAEASSLFLFFVAA
jgi:SAM-dependent methyltransferase